LPRGEQIHRHDIADAFEVVHCLDQLDDLAAIFRGVLRFRYLASVLKDRGGQTANFHAVVSQNFKVVRRSLNHGRYPASRQLQNELHCIGEACLASLRSLSYTAFLGGATEMCWRATATAQPQASA
jgi:hypothetical protein